MQSGFALASFSFWVIEIFFKEVIFTFLANHETHIWTRLTTGNSLMVLCNFLSYTIQNYLTCYQSSVILMSRIPLTVCWCHCTKPECNCMIFRFLCFRPWSTGTHKIVLEKQGGKVEFDSGGYHFASTVRSAATSGGNRGMVRARKLAQEVPSLATSLPLSFSSRVFVRSDKERLDVMKVIDVHVHDAYLQKWKM